MVSTREYGRRQSQAPSAGRAPRWGATLLAVWALVACGGGGGAEPPTSVTPPTEPPANNPDSGQSTGPALDLGLDSFLFRPEARFASLSALETLMDGGNLFAAWNPRNPQTVLKPGMKVMFFGAAQGCAASAEGPLATVPSDRMAELASLTALPANASHEGLRWTPSGRADGCDSETQARSGGSSVFLNPDNAAGVVALLTTSGPQANGEVPFLGPFGVNGQDGRGANAHITGSFVNFRAAWSKADPVQPWLNGSKARIQSTQGLGGVKLEAAPGVTAQVKQQVAATFLNPACLRALADAGKPCQVQYLLNTGIQRTGVTDWSTVPWFQKGDVWYDPAQGGIPIVDGPIYPTGQTTLETQTGLGLFTSQGSATQHRAFASRTFDVTISFEQLNTVLRVTAAKAAGVGVAAVNAGHLQAHWGPQWDDPAAWVLLSVDVGQEVYNPDPSRRVEIGGGFSSLYVGPQ